ncbi:MAG: HAD-IB family hydrolase [Sinobacteraceae bacterium]|nr:HAD-IB family hydrolase [Nevskiaceae bacterium]MCP5467163.1 HAD-IB family hydrolase [Nevskiaceae bacterium]
MSHLVFFDLDGTISRRDTLLPYVAGFLLRHPWRSGRLLAVLPPLLAFACGRGDRGALKGALIHAGMGGASRAQVTAWTERFLPRLFARGFHPAALAAIETHRRNGDHLVLMSASVDLYVPEIGRRLGFHETVCSGTHWQAQQLDGRLATPNRRDQEKARCFREIAALHPGVDTVAYGNAASDLPHMQLATRAVMVNPSAALRQQCERLGIETVNWLKKY